MNENQGVQDTKNQVRKPLIGVGLFPLSWFSEDKLLGVDRQTKEGNSKPDWSVCKTQNTEHTHTHTFTEID